MQKLKSKIIFGFVFMIFNTGAFSQQNLEGERWILIKDKESDSECPFYEIAFGKDDYSMSITNDSVQVGLYKVKGEYLQILNSLDGCDFFNPKNKYNYRFKKKENDIVILKYNKIFKRKKKTFKIEN